MSNFNIQVSDSEVYNISVNTSTADQITRTSSQDKFFLEIEQGTDGTAESTKNIIEITTALDSDSDSSSLTIQKANDINLVISTDCIVSHPSISAASSVDNNGSLFIQDILLDSYGHVTGISSAYATGTGIGGGSSNFLDLLDTPSTFAGQAGKYVVVNPGESALEFVSGSFSSTETDPIFTGSVAYNISSSDTGNWNTAYGWGNHATGGYLISGDNISLLNNNVPYAISGSHMDITGASDVDNTGNVFVQDIFMDQYGHVTGIRTAPATGEGADSNYYVTGASFNSGNNHLILTRTDGGTVTGILSGVVVSGSNYHISVNGTGVSESGRTYVQDILVDSYGHITGIVTATETVVDTNTEYSDGVGLSLSGTVFSIDDTVIQSGDNVSLLNNDAGYISSYTETDPIFTGHVTYNISSGDITNWNASYGWGDHSTSGYATTGYVNSVSGYLQGQIDSLPSDTNTFVTGVSYNSSTHELVLTRNSGSVTGILNDVVHSGDNISLLSNDAGYITGYIETGINTFVTSLAFDSGTNNLVLQRNDSVSITGQLDGVLVSGTSYHISVDGTGVDGSGRTYVQDILVDSYGHITGINTATETVVDTNTFVTGISYSSSSHELVLTRNSGSVTGILENVAHSGDNISIFVNNSGYINAETDPIFTGHIAYNITGGDINNWNESYGWGDHSLSGYATTGQLNNVSGSLQSQIDAIPDDTNTFVTGLSYDSSTHQLTLIRNSGSVTGVLSDIIHSGDNVSLLVNDAGYLTGLVGATGSFDYIDFTNLEEADYPSHLEGRLFYDSGNHALAYYNDETEVTLQIGQEEFLRVRNNTTGTITNGSLVYIIGSHANAAAAIDLAIATGNTESAVAGFATHDIEASTFGYVTTFGMVRDVSTIGIAAGSEIYLSHTTAGAFTGIPPVVPNYSMPVGYVIREHATNGSVLAFIGKHKLGGGDLKSEATAILSGIPFVTTVADNNGGGLTTSTGLVYDSGNQNLYVGGSEVLVSGDSISQLVNDTNFTDGSGTANYVAKWSDSDTLTSGIIYDDGTGVGIGTASSSVKLDVAGDINSTLASNNKLVVKTNSVTGKLQAYDALSSVYAGAESNHHFVLRSNNTDRLTLYNTNEGVWNENGLNYDFRAEGSSDTHLLFTDANTNRVGIGTSSPAYKLDVSGTFSADSVNVNDAFTLPTGDGSDGQVLATDGSGNVQWEHPRSSYIMSVMFG